MPQYEDVYEPPLMDATFIDKIDDLIAELQNLSAPSATNVSVDATEMDVITATNAQGALKQLDTALANSLKTQQVQFILPQTVTLNANTSGILLDHFDISTSNITDTIFTNKKLSELFGGHTVLGVVGLWCSSGLIPLETIVWPNTNELTIRFYNQASGSITVSAIRLLVLYS